MKPSDFSSPLCDTCVPHTCSCEIEPYVEETVLDLLEEVEFDPKHIGRDVKTKVLGAGVLKMERQHHKTVRKDKTGRVLKEKKHPPNAAHPGLGSRLRGQITKPCPGHAGFSGVLQTQRVKIPTVCGCVWQELWAGDEVKESFFGAHFEKVCDGHASQIADGTISLKDLRSIIMEASRVE